MYLVIVMGLYLRRIIGWAMGKHMTTELVEQSMQMAITLRKLRQTLIFHNDRGSQYISKRFGSLLKHHSIQASMSGVGACWGNDVVERFLGSLKYEWLLKVYHLIRQSMKQDVKHYIRYYNRGRLYSANGDLSPIAFDLSQIKVSG
jgi:putative transposase